MKKTAPKRFALKADFTFKCFLELFSLCAQGQIA